MDGIFARIFNLSFYISSQLIRIIEGLFYTTVNGCSEKLVVNLHGESLTSLSNSCCKSVFEGNLSSITHCQAVTYPGIYGRSSLTYNELPVNSTREADIKHVKGASPSFFRAFCLKCKRHCGGHLTTLAGCKILPVWLLLKMVQLDSANCFKELGTEQYGVSLLYLFERQIFGFDSVFLLELLYGR
ncbi:hypothetical protein Ancab_012144 [Ancistrocladus abbreviatus]